MDQFNYRGDIIKVYTETSEGFAGWEHIRNGVTYRRRGEMCINHHNKNVIAKQDINYFDSNGDVIRSFKPEPRKDLVITKDLAEYNQFADMTDLAGLTLGQFINRAFVNGMLQQHFRADNLVCYNPAAGYQFFQPMTSDDTILADSIECNMVDGDAATAKIYYSNAGVVPDYITCLQSPASQEKSVVGGNVLFTTVPSGTHRLFLFDALGNFSQKLVTV